MDNPNPRNNDDENYTAVKADKKVDKDSYNSLYNPRKAAIMINFKIFFTSLMQLAAKFLYMRNPELTSIQLLFMRGLLSTIITLIYLNTKTGQVAQEPCRKGKVFNLCIRMLVTLCTMTIKWSIIKYVSLVYVSMTSYFTPLVTVFMSYMVFAE